MKFEKKLTLLFPALVLLIGATTLAGCNQVEDHKSASAAADTNSAEMAASGKILHTTASEEARKEFLQGRDLAERLLIQDSIQHFDKAISLDPNFALAHLNRANVSPTAREFFDHLKKAVSLADKASEGERLLILGTEAGANGNALKQKETLEKLVAAYPNDERARFALGGYYFGQQDFDSAILHYKKATELAPRYSPAYNILGYALRQKENYADAEQAFKKYIELIPDDPNPYDSLAELFLKMGKFDDAITQYRKALAIDSNFINSHLGIGAALMYQGKAEEAAAEFNKITSKARSDGERRTALFALTVLAVDSGKVDQALAEVGKQYALGEKTADMPNLAGDSQLKGNILLEAGKYDEAKQAFERSLKTTMDSNLSQEIKDNTRLFQHYNLTRVALGKNDLATAKTESQEFRKGAEALKNPAQVKQAHELAGLIALVEKNYDQAITELQQTNLQNPQNLYRLAQAYQGKGDTQKAKEFSAKAEAFHSLPNLNYAFIRNKAAKQT
jgi:tetratricopeptide (TPR) repeat protein